MEACNVPNVGATPDGNTVQERFYAEQEDSLLHMMRIQQLAQSMGIQMPEPGNGSGKKGGRPPSGQAAPQLAQKGDGRPVVKES